MSIIVASNGHTGWVLKLPLMHASALHSQDKFPFLPSLEWIYQVWMAFFPPPQTFFSGLFPRRILWEAFSPVCHVIDHPC